VHVTALLVGGDARPREIPGDCRWKLAEKLEYEGHDSLSVAGSGTTDLPVPQFGSIVFPVSVMDDIDMAEHEDVRNGAVFGESDEGVNTV
jgi:hypothetical protein